MLKSQSDVCAMMSVKVILMTSKMSGDVKIQFKKKAKSECLDNWKITF
jgi:hypothetical protein